MRQLGWMLGSEDFAEVKVEILCRGIRSNDVEKGRKGGAGVPGCYVLLPGERCVNVPLRGAFVASSPLELKHRDDGWVLCRDGEPICSISFVPEPTFYSMRTSDGVPMRMIALLHGRECLASTIHQKCIYWGTEDVCRFCGIELSLNYGDTIEYKTPEQLREVAEAAVAEGVANHITLTIGTRPWPDKGALLLAEATRVIKEGVGIPIHVQIDVVKNLGFLEDLKAAGADTIGIHIETFDYEILKRVCPGKARYKDLYEGNWRKAVEIFGENQVSSWLIAGLGETDSSIIQGAEKLAELGVVPYLVPLRPIPGTPFGDLSPPEPLRMLRLYESLIRIFRKHGLHPNRNRAGCVRCGACSALGDFMTL